MDLIDRNIPVLDHGFVRVVNYMGDDSSIVQAARVSYGKGTKSVREDTGLINYLMRHAHTSPFEMCEIVFHIKMPIFVARQWLRHRTANVNEYSARYSVLEDDFYIPENSTIRTQSSSNKQGRGELVRDPDFVKDHINGASSNAYAIYDYLLDSEKVSRELSRIVLPVNVYTQMYWKIDLNNLLKFLKLRLDSHAQWETVQYAKAIESIIKEWVPITYEAFEKYILRGAALSQKEVKAVTSLIADFGVSNIRRPSGFTDGEWGEFLSKFGA